MPAPSRRLAVSLGVLRRLQRGTRRVFESSELSRLHRERLIRNGFLVAIMKDWLFSTEPGTHPGESTPWYASFWEFCARYCEARFEEAWHLTAEHTVIPARIVVRSPRASNNRIDLPFGMSIYDLKERNSPSASELTVRDGLRLYSPAAALVRIPDCFVRRNPVELRIVLASAADVAEILRPLLEGGRSVVAGRLAGALRRVGGDDDADEVLNTMRSAGYDAREKDPFAPDQRTGPEVAKIPRLFVGCGRFGGRRESRSSSHSPRLPGCRTTGSPTWAS